MFSCIERSSTRSAHISWYDSTFGHYTEQRWVLCVSRINGVCALTGQRVSTGDTVFRPAARHPMKPCNAGTMILETSLNEKLAAQSAHETESRNPARSRGG